MNITVDNFFYFKSSLYLSFVIQEYGKVKRERRYLKIKTSSDFTITSDSKNLNIAGRQDSGVELIAKATYKRAIKKQLKTI